MSGLNCCRRHRAGLPLVGDDVAIRCGDLTAEDGRTLTEAASEAIGDRDEGVFGHPPAAGRIAADLAAALLVALEQLAAVTAERAAYRATVEDLRRYDCRADVADGRPPLVEATGPLEID